MTLVSLRVTGIQLACAPAGLAERKPWYASTAIIARKHPLGTAGFMVVAVMIVMSLLAEVIAPYDPELIDVEVMLTPPGPEFWLGIDQFGRGRHNQWLP